MNISSIKPEGVYASKGTAKSSGKGDASIKSEDKKGARAADKLEISPEAQMMSSIMAKMKSGFYNSPEVIKETAQKLSQQLPPESL